MVIEPLRLIFDFGLLVLIWMVQIIVYPSFQFFQKENLIKWHEKYTRVISFVVIPLMFGQLIITVLQLIKIQSVFNICSLVLIGLVWAITFSQFVPMHSKISAGNADEILLKRIVKMNWSRTLLWTVIFIWNLLTSL
ncbi:MAG: hypothetical protein AB8B59_09155 [Maribacter sp.]